MQDARFSFRAGAPLAEALAHRVHKAGCSVSEYLRSIVRDHVGLCDPAPSLDIAATPAKSVHELASRGDARGFAELAGLHHQRGLAGAEPAIIAYARAVDYARLAAAARGDRQDWLAFLYLLEQHALALREAGLGDLADMANGEAVAIAEFMAEDGDDEIADMLASTADNLTPKALTVARELRDHAKGALTC
jgi:hypothetical protein